MASVIGVASLPVSCITKLVIVIFLASQLQQASDESNISERWQSRFE